MQLLARSALRRFQAEDSVQFQAKLNQSKAKPYVYRNEPFHRAP